MESVPKKICESHDVYHATRGTYYWWDKELGKYGALAGRVHIAWHKIERFCQQHNPAMLCTLRQVLKLISHSSKLGALYV